MDRPFLSFILRSPPISFVLMAYADIQDYLVRRGSYAEGLELVVKYELASDIQLKMFKAAESRFNLRKINSLLSAHQEKKPETLQKKKTSESVKPKYTKPQIETLPKDLQLLHSHIIALYGHRSAKRQELIDCNYTKKGIPRKSKNQAQSDRLCGELLKIQDQINSGWKRIDYWFENKQYLPGTEPLDEENQIKYWLKNQVPYQNYVTRYRNQSKRPNEALYAYRLSVISDIQNFLNGGE